MKKRFFLTLCSFVFISGAPVNEPIQAQSVTPTHENIEGEYVTSEFIDKLSNLDKKLEYLDNILIDEDNE